MTNDQIAEHVKTAGGIGGRIVVRFRDYLVPKLDEAYEAIKDEVGNTIHEHHPLGHMRIVAGSVVALIDNHLALGAGPGKPIDHLIPLADIEHAQADPVAVDVTPLPPVELPLELPPAPEVAPLSGAEMVASGEVL